ncbi:MAG: deoxyribose-phosphate aldolase [Candidatus Sumerlaeia bacterium]|nr:deoxyribose-phosphate aldolase [Candidatus Sumerlaeia bacterium]
MTPPLFLAFHRRSFFHPWDVVPMVPAALLDRLNAALRENSPASYPVEARPNIASYLDHTYLKPEGGAVQIEKLCAEAREYGFASVCIQPRYVGFCKELLAGSGVKVCTVIGFPLGANSPITKAFESGQAVFDGADEVDMVLSVGELKAGKYLNVFEDIRGVVQAADGRLVKVILETSYLNDEEKMAGCLISQRAGAHYVKTSTGFSSAGATVADIRLMRATVGPLMGVKASGGIRDTATAQAMIEAGATRLGVSAGVEIVKGLQGKEQY